MLKREILDFYEERHIGVERLITHRRPSHLTAAQIEAAAEKIYKHVKRGQLNVPTRELPMRIWRKATKMDGGRHASDRERFMKVDSIIADKDARIAELEGEIENLTNNLHLFGIKKLVGAIFRAMFPAPAGDADVSEV